MRRAQMPTFNSQWHKFEAAYVGKGGGGLGVGGEEVPAEVSGDEVGPRLVEEIDKWLARKRAEVLKRAQEAGL